MDVRNNRWLVNAFKRFISTDSSYLPASVSLAVEEFKEAAELIHIHKETKETANPLPQHLQPVADYVPVNLVLQTLLQQLFACICQVMDVDTVAVLLQTEGQDQLAVYATLGLEEEIVEGIRIPMGQGFAGRIAASKKLVIVEDLSKAEVVSPILRDKGLRSMLGTPLLSGDRVIGVLHVGTFDPRQFTRKDTQLLQRIADQIGLAITKIDILEFSTVSKKVDTSSQRWHRYRESFLTALLGSIPSPVGVKLRQLLYSSIFAHLGKNSYIHSGCEFRGGNHIEIGDAVKIYRDVIISMSSNSFLRIGNNVCLKRGVDISVAGSDCVIEIGNGTSLGPYVCMAGPGHIKIGKGCLIASQSGLYANNHRANGISREGIEIGDKCWLGTGVKVLDGVKIGRGCVIGAGAVVTKNIPPLSVAVGVPAKVIKESKGEGRC